MLRLVSNRRFQRSQGRSHLSSDRARQYRAGTGQDATSFAEKALAILRPLAPDHPDQTDVRFLLGLAASRGSQESEVGEGGNGSRCWTRLSRRSGPS